MTKTGMTIQKAVETDKKSWNSHVRHPLQTWEWGEFRTAMGIDLVRTRFGQITFHRIPYTPWTIGYFPKGPKPTKDMITHLQKLGTEKNAIFIQLEPDMIANYELRIADYGLRPSHHPLFTKYTFILDLTKSEDALLQSMHAKTRYNLKVAQKHGVTVIRDDSDDAFRAYLSLNEETLLRQGFYAHNRLYHETMWRILHRAGIASLFLAKYGETVLAAWIIFTWGKTAYYPYGASSRQHREVMAPTLMLWEITRWAKKEGFTAFDLWGALGPEPDPADPWFGFHRFKQGFSPDPVEYIGSYDLVIKPVLYRMYTIADTIRWSILKHRRK